MVNKLRRFLFLSVTAYGVILVGMFSAQRDLMYHPDVTPLRPPAEYGLKTAQAVTLNSEQDVTLNCWYIPPQEGMPLLIYFHGNAGNLSSRIQKISAFTAQGMGMLAVSYRGFGGSGGRITEQGLYADARAALTYATAEQKIPGEKIIFYGESLGSGVATQLATEYKAGMVVLEAPFISVVERAQELYPWLPVSMMLIDQFESIEKIAQIQTPLLVFHNTGDTVIPIEHGRALYRQAKAPKRALWFAHQGHSDFDWKRLEREVREYYGKRA